MIPAHWTAPLGNHLWQSTLFAAVVALLALCLRKNQARTRYWLWLIASVKFLIPFSLLVTAGSYLKWPTAAPITPPRLSVVIGQVTQPFPHAQTTATVAPPVLAHSGSILPVFLLAIWICGFLAVVFSWWDRFLRVRAAVRAGSPLALEAEIPVLSSPVLLEPGVFGIFRPVLLLPEGIAERLAPTHLEAIIAHELCHVRRRDNLAAAIHMAVEAIFWFHPLVWWIGARLVEERERACDEEVLRLGNEPEIYAETILRTCQFYLESPLVCVSGITGSDLKKRIVHIMTERLTTKLSLGRKLLLVGTAAAVVGGPVISGFVNASQSQGQWQATKAEPLPSFEVASIKPNHSADRRSSIMLPPGRFTATNATTKMLIEFAYNIKDPQLSGGPPWINSERYDVDAKAEESAVDETRKLSPDERVERLRLMVRSLLADRFQLKVGHEKKELPVYVLMVANNGPKLHESAVPAGDLGGPSPHGGQHQPLKGRMARMSPGQITMAGAPISLLADALSRQLGRNVVDKTGLKGNYDITLQWTPDPSQGPMFKGPANSADGGPPMEPAPPPPDASGVSIFTALQEQLGLKLESQKGPVDTVVIEQIERPSEN